MYRASLLVAAGLLGVAAWQPPAALVRDPAIYRQVNHLGWVVKDLDAVISAWRTFGVTSIGDAVTMDIPITDRGQPRTITVRRAVAQIGAQQIHWIQPLGTSDVFAEFLAAHGEGVHHIAFEVPSRERLDDEVRSLSTAGVAVTQEGQVPTSAGTVSFAYLDTVPGGITVELEHNPASSTTPSPPSANEEPFNKITQFAFVVRDLKSVSDFWARAGFSAIPFQRNVSLDRVYRGQPGRFEMLLGFVRTGEVPFEWIQPLTGPSVYEEYVAAHREGFHHLGFAVADLDATMSRLRTRGLNVSMSGRWDTNGSQGRFAYLDTERHGGVTIELLWDKPSPRERTGADAGLSPEAMRQFLLTAKVVRHKRSAKASPARPG